jgi:twinkle protein
MSFKKYSEIDRSPVNENDYLKIHNKRFSQLVMGLPKGGLVLVSGLRGQGKSTWLGQTKLDLIDNGYKGLEFSLEMSNKKTLNWTILQACGKDNLNAKQTTNGKTFYCPKSEKIENDIIEWIDDKLLIDDNSTFNAKVIERQIVEKLESSTDIDFCIIDNMMRLDIAEYGGEKLLAQIKFAKTITDICQKKNICLLLVIHPTKVFTLPRIDNLAGAGELLNLASLVLILHKVNTDFKVKQKQLFNFKDDHEILQFDTLLEIAKDRDFGQDDNLIGLYFEEESKRFIEYKGQNIKYKWQKEYSQARLEDLQEVEDDGLLPF